MALQRKVSEQFDQTPSLHHIYNYKIAKPYIKGKKVLDIGCWTGQFEKLAEKDAKEIFAIDPYPEAIKYAQKSVPKAKFQVGTAEKLPFRDALFDTVCILEVIEHVSQNTEQQTLGEIHRVLKKGGFLILSTPNWNIIAILLDPAYFLLGHRHYSYKQISELLKESGFKVVKTKTTVGIVNLLIHNIQLISKFTLGKYLSIPNWMKQKQESEYTNGGFGQLHFIAQKI